MHYTHFEVAGYICAAIFIIYVPPRILRGLGGFAERHFGDSVGFYILHLGIVLVILGGIYQQVTGIASTGNALILAAMGILKLTKTAAPDTVETIKLSNVTASAPVIPAPDPPEPTKP